MSSVSEKTASRHRTWVGGGLALCLGVGMILAVLQGRAAWSIADSQFALDAAVQAGMQAPELDTLALLEDASVGLQAHRRVALEGFWLARHTVFVARSDAQGRAGFDVWTPLQLDAETAVLVQRGWVGHDAQQNLPRTDFETDGGVIRLQGRIGPVPALSLPAVAAPSGPPGSSRIRHNLDLAQLREETGVPLQALVVQTDAPDEGLARDLPMPADSAQHHKTTAERWFALAAALAMLILWFFILRPLFHARRLRS